MFFRALAYMIVSILLITVLRSVIGMIMQFLNGALMGSRGAGQGPQGQRSQGYPGAGPRRQAKPTASEPLKKDPVCGTFVAPSTAVQIHKGGETLYFCSAACRDKFAA